jgi:hypothetical protein
MITAGGAIGLLRGLSAASVVLAAVAVIAVPFALRRAGRKHRREVGEDIVSGRFPDQPITFGKPVAEGRAEKAGSKGTESEHQEDDYDPDEIARARELFKSATETPIIGDRVSHPGIDDAR